MNTVIFMSDKKTGAAMIFMTNPTIIAEARGQLAGHQKLSWPPVDELMSCEMDLRREFLRARRADRLARYAEGAIDLAPTDGTRGG
ncbi:hypothetical protein BFP70_16010 [Thioclava sp. SK-1]|uniref:hypothetical protein n=1 Tax=Thioclava sp. SK-1 TaxID=1889770 RepID=UPI0008257D67|nr:hypothetical protein [Thioclava sp. SK-1]OCX60971.1 hypothetical protein BFP70_16010 [Thioclava sp. SK-1]